MSKKKGAGDTAPDDRDKNSGYSAMERYRRRRAVRVSKLVFRTIDIVYKRRQNACPYITADDKKAIEIKQDVVYDGNTPDVCKMDVYSMPQDTPRPAVIFVHGGGFMAGDKKYRKGRSMFYAKSGFNVFCVNHGLAPAFRFPEPIVQLVNAANYIYDHAEEFNIDRERIIVAGDSSGGYYAAIIAAFNCGDSLKKQLGVELRFRVAGVLLNCGIFDMDALIKNPVMLHLDDSVFLSLAGFRVNELDRYEYKDILMPLPLINEDFPPAYVIYSGKDVFCKGQSPALIEKLNKLGVRCEYYKAKNKRSNHCFSLTWKSADAKAANAGVIGFAKDIAGIRD